MQVRADKDAGLGGQRPHTARYRTILHDTVSKHCSTSASQETKSKKLLCQRDIGRIAMYYS